LLPIHPLTSWLRVKRSSSFKFVVLSTQGVLFLYPTAKFPANGNAHTHTIPGASCSSVMVPGAYDALFATVACTTCADGCCSRTERLEVTVDKHQQKFRRCVSVTAVCVSRTRPPESKRAFGWPFSFPSLERGFLGAGYASLFSFFGKSLFKSSLTWRFSLV